MSTIKIFLLTTFFSATCSFGFAQISADYTPANTTNPDKKLFISRIEKRLEKDISAIKDEKVKEVENLFEDRARFLIEKAKKDEYLFDAPTTLLIQSVFKEINEKNNLGLSELDILVDRRPDVNASCSGEGTITINLGLIRRLENESQLAFVLAHEMAHHLKNHVNNKIYTHVDQFYGKESKEKLKELTNQKSDISQLERTFNLMLDLIYQSGGYSREKEMEADAYAIGLLEKTKYNLIEAQSFLYKMDSADYPKYNKESSLSTVFDFSKYPFKSKWLKKPVSRFEDDRTNATLFNTDMMKTHPSSIERAAVLNPIIASAMGKNTSGIDNNQVKEIAEMADFEVIESAIFFKTYDVALYFCLQQLSVYPDNRYLKTTIMKIMTELYWARKNHEFGKYVATSVMGLNEPLNETNIFLNNLRLSELGQIAYHYINNQSNFDTESEEHYYYAWQMAAMLEKPGVEKAVKEKYFQNFPKGKYLLKLKSK